MDSAVCLNVDAGLSSDIGECDLSGLRVTQLKRQERQNRQYQQRMMWNAHISRVVRAEFAQYAPDRVASVTTTPMGPDTKIHVLVKGLTYEESSVTITNRDFWSDKNSGRTGSAEIEVSLQRRNPNLGNDPHLGWENVEPPTLLMDDQKNPREWEGDVILKGSIGAGPFPGPASGIRMVPLRFRIRRKCSESHGRAPRGLCRRVFDQLTQSC